MRLALDGQRNTTQSTDIPVVVWMEHIWRSVCSNLSSRVTGSVHLPRPSGAIRPLCRPGWTWRRHWAKAIPFAHPPLVPVLHRFEELCGEPAAGFIHWGATTQNIFDTASALQMVRTHRLLAGPLDAAIAAL